MEWAIIDLKRVLKKSDPGIWGPEDADGGISVLRSTNFLDDASLDLTRISLRALPGSKAKSKLLQPGDIVLERSGGSPRQPVGRVCFFAGDDQPHAFGNFCQRLRPDHRTVEPKYLLWYLHKFHLSGGTLALQKQTTGIRNLDYKGYLKQSIPLPPLSEQRRIVEILDQADRLRRLRAEADAKADRILPALFIKMFGDPTTNSMDWPVVPFGKVFKDITARCPKLQRKDYRPAGRFPVVDQGKGAVAGYCDDEDLCCRPERPIVVFGDHTRVVKLIDFPFVAGADGSRVLQVYPSFAPEFAAVAFQLQPIPNLGYSRHMRIVRRVSFIAPPLSSQEQFESVHRVHRQLATRRGRADKEIERLWQVMLVRAFSGSLTVSWRASHMKELLQEMEQQAKALAHVEASS